MSSSALQMRLTELTSRDRENNVKDASLVFNLLVSQCRRDVYQRFDSNIPAYSKKLSFWR